MDHIIITEGPVGRTDFFSISKRCYILYWPYSLCKRNGTSFCVLSWRSGHTGYLHKCPYTQIHLNTFIIMHTYTCTQTHVRTQRYTDIHTHAHINTSPIHTLTDADTCCPHSLLSWQEKVLSFVHSAFLPKFGFMERDCS